MNREPKSVKELKRSIINLQQNNANLYKICTALFQEIQEVKHFVNYKHDDSLGDVESSRVNITQTPIQNNVSSSKSKQVPSSATSQKQSINILDNVEEYTESVPTVPTGRKLRIIN